MKEIEKVGAFTKMCCTIGNLPTSYMISMTYEEQLIWLCNYLEKTVIPAVNNNAEATEELQRLYLELKRYVDDYFENLDVQEEINNKLDEMAESGELADIIFNLEKIPFIPNEEQHNFQNDVRRNIISYLNIANVCNSRVGEATGDMPICFKYETAKGYLGLLNWGEFDYDDTERIDDVDYKVFYAECGTLASLIYKDIPYENSPYYNIWNNIYTIDSEEMYLSALENQSQNKPYTIDMYNQWTARYVAYNLNKSGNIVHTLCKHDSQGPHIDETIANNMETGDFVFVGRSTKVSDGNYQGINHVGVYVKTLEELNNFYDDGITYKAYNNHEDEGYGYIFEMMPSASESNDYTDCIRITALYDYFTQNLNGKEWESVYTGKPYSNSLNDSKALKLAIGLESDYRYLRMFDLNPSDRNETFTLNRSYGELKTNSLKIGGRLFTSSTINLNTFLDNGIRTVLSSSQLTNAPSDLPSNSNVTIINIGGTSDTNYKDVPQTRAIKQILLVENDSYGEIIYIRSNKNALDNDSSDWSNWNRIDMFTNFYVSIPSNTDLNNLLTSGKYSKNNTSDVTNLPSPLANVGFTLEVERSQSGRYIKQTLTSHSKTNPRIYVRLSGNVVTPTADDWSDWINIMDTGA